MASRKYVTLDNGHFFNVLTCYFIFVFCFFRIINQTNLEQFLEEIIPCFIYKAEVLVFLAV